MVIKSLYADGLSFIKDEVSFTIGASQMRASVFDSAHRDSRARLCV